MLNSMTIRLIHADQLETPYLCYGVKCQSGVIWGHGGQMFIFLKKASNPSDYVALNQDLRICSSLTPLYKSYGRKKMSGVIWGHWGQKVIFTKNAIICPCYIV